MREHLICALQCSLPVRALYLFPPAVLSSRLGVIYGCTAVHCSAAVVDYQGVRWWEPYCIQSIHNTSSVATSLDSRSTEIVCKVFTKPTLRCYGHGRRRDDPIDSSCPLGRVPAVERCSPRALQAAADSTPYTPRRVPILSRPRGRVPWTPRRLASARRARTLRTPAHAGQYSPSRAAGGDGRRKTDDVRPAFPSWTLWRSGQAGWAYGRRIVVCGLVVVWPGVAPWSVSAAPDD